MASIKYKNVSRLRGVQIPFSIVVMGMMLFLTGCLAGLPLQTEKPSDHFEIEFIETHQGSTKQEIVQKLGGPARIFRSTEKTYYVYDATGDTRLIVGAVFVVPPFFVPFWTPKDEGDALHCLALIFDEKGLLQGYIAKTASEQAYGGVVLPGAEPAAWSWGQEVTACDRVIWDEEELAKLELVPEKEEFRSLGYTMPSDRYSLWAWKMFGRTKEGYEWLCLAAEHGGVESRIQLGNCFYDRSHLGNVIYFDEHRSSENLARAYVWYRLSDKADDQFVKSRLESLNKYLTGEQLSRAEQQLRDWGPGNCMNDVLDGGLLNKEKIPENTINKYYQSPNSIEGQRALCVSADNGYAASQAELARLYRHGLQGVTKNINLAYMWYSLAIDRQRRIEPNEAVRVWEKEVSSMRKTLSPAQLTEAESKIKSWRPGQCERDLLEMRK